ncbi:hypothetical protein B0H14DRAFT_2593594 [Mycena olivaceomarginata]|nr:hypothetical protein B0H14DRAFT_2593594 [Mycena olivaceomarginata]
MATVCRLPLASRYLSVPLLYRRVGADDLQTSQAVVRLRAHMNGPAPQLIRIGVRNKGCAGLSYNLEYVEKPGKFDKVVEQDGVRVVIDDKALFWITGSEMGLAENLLSSKFVFRNPNIKDACGCGESFAVEGRNDCVGLNQSREE